MLTAFFQVEAPTHLDLARAVLLSTRLRASEIWPGVRDLVKNEKGHFGRASQVGLLGI